ncbi:MAG: TlpA family protein disulfide reductase [Saprospiraceae bacterium]
MKIAILVVGICLLIGCEKRPQGSQFVTQLLNDEISKKETKQLTKTLKEIEFSYKKEFKSFNNLIHFVDYINKDNSESGLKLQSFFIYDLIRHPMKWDNHKYQIEKTILRDVYRSISEKNISNPYELVLHEAMATLYIDKEVSNLPELLLETPEGKSELFSELNEKIVIGYFWATWCSPCVIEKPYWESIAKKYKGNSNIHFVRISIDENKKAWKKHKLDTNGVKDYIVGEEVDKVREKFSIHGVPRFFIADAKGVYFAEHAPKPSSELFSFLIEEAIEDQKKQ